MKEAESRIHNAARVSFVPSFFILVAALLCFQSAFAQSPENKAAGLSVTFTTENTSDTTTTPNVWLYVPAGQSPTPFLPADKFKAVWNGFVAVDLRGDYSFQAEMNGSLKLELNGKTVLETTTNGVSDLSQSVRLGKGGTNILTASFISPLRGDAFIRLFWKPKDSFVQPIPLAALKHTASAEGSKAAQIRLGRELFIEHRCEKCHAGKLAAAIPELSMDAPSFEEIGSRRSFEWLTKWIEDPKTQRPLAQMPKMLHGEKSKQDTEDIADFLGSLNSKAGSGKNPDESKAVEGEKLFSSLHCVACHTDPAIGETDARKISLKQVAVKFTPGSLADFLRKPDEHYTWIRMPQFKLSDDQFASLAAYLISKSDKPSLRREPPGSANIERGKNLVQASGCLNCHGLKLENKFSTKTLADISDWKKGCLAENHGGKSPDFHFSAEQRAAIQAFAATDRASLTRHVPADYAERYSRILNCRSCHGQFEGFPNLEILGEKLKPEWMAKFIAGEVHYKPRPWLESQMPAFAKFAEPLATGLAAQHGFALQTAPEPAINEEASKTGHQLVGNPPKGFSCISCHSVGSFGATQVFEAPGIDLIHSGERLQPSYFKYWLRNPPLVDPQTKMPAYFDEEGKSPISDVYEGDAWKQIDALWQYIRLGTKMPLPQAQ